jgi:hypothetical protein
MQPSPPSAGADGESAPLDDGVALASIHASAQLEVRMKATARLLVLGALLATLSACETLPAPDSSAAEAPPEQLNFLDTPGFDQRLSSSLSAQLPTVNVGFYDKVSPNALPERLQAWLSAVEAGGGKVKVVKPKGEITAKSPFMLLSLASSLWTASKAAREVSARSHFLPAQQYDAALLLKLDDAGQTVVDTVVFTARAKPLSP